MLKERSRNIQFEAFHVFKVILNTTLVSKVHLSTVIVQNFWMTDGLD
jgi:hypothetical protein